MSPLLLPKDCDALGASERSCATSSGAAAQQHRQEASRAADPVGPPTPTSAREEAFRVTCAWPRIPGLARGPVPAERLYLTAVPSLSVSAKGSVCGGRFCRLRRFLDGALVVEPLPPLVPSRFQRVRLLESLCPRECFVSVPCLSRTLLMFLPGGSEETVRAVGGSLIGSGGEIPSLPPLLAFFRDPSCPSVPPLQEVQGSAARPASSGGGFKASFTGLPW